MTNDGWIKLHRKITSHWVYQDSKKFKAWMAILFTVNHEKQKVNIGNQLIECDRGESVQSLSSWVKIFGENWSIKRVRNFFRLLVEDGMIVIESVGVSTRLTVCNYDDYQDSGQAKGKQRDSNGQDRGNGGATNKNDKNDKNIIFVDFWELYDKKVGSKKRCEKKWNTLDWQTQTHIISFLPEWLKQFPDKQFQPFPETFLNQERWQDDLKSIRKVQTSPEKPVTIKW